VPDAEIVVHARAGERRVVAFDLRNSGRREKEVRIEVSRWTTCGGPQLHLQTDFDVPETITLGPCESRVVRLFVAVAAAEDQKGDQRQPDVDACASAYSDVRFDGCARPIRVAVVVHPTQCDAYEVTCDCGCC